MAYNDLRMDNQWLPFTPNRSFAKDPRVFVAADGMHFTTHDGRQVIDGISSLWCVGAGHNRKPINEAIKKQLDTLDYSTAFSVSNDKAFRAAEMIAAMAPGDLNKVLFCNSGSEAADTSMKVALAYHRARGEGHRNMFIGRERGYHGVGFGGMSVAAFRPTARSTAPACCRAWTTCASSTIRSTTLTSTTPSRSGTKTCCWSWRTASCRCTIRATSPL